MAADASPKLSTQQSPLDNASPQHSRPKNTQGPSTLAPTHLWEESEVDVLGAGHADARLPAPRGVVGHPAVAAGPAAEALALPPARCSTGVAVWGLERGAVCAWPHIIASNPQQGCTSAHPPTHPPTHLTAMTSSSMLMRPMHTSRSSYLQARRQTGQTRELWEGEQLCVPSAPSSAAGGTQCIAALLSSLLSTALP